MGNENSGNPNPTRTEEFLEKAKETQFGGVRGNPQSQNLPGSNEAWSIRGAARRFAAQEADPNDAQALQNILTHDGTRKPTLAQLTAMAQIKKAITMQDTRACEWLSDSIEGKLALPIRNEGEIPNLPTPTINITVSGEKKGE